MGFAFSFGVHWVNEWSLKGYKKNEMEEIQFGIESESLPFTRICLSNGDEVKPAYII